MRLSRRERLVAGLAGVALVVWTSAVVLLSDDVVPELWQLTLVGALLAASQLVVAPARNRADQLAFPSADAALLVGLVSVGPAWFIALALPCLLAVHLLMRRSPWASVYNASSVVVAAGLAAGPLRLFDAMQLSLSNVSDVLSLVAAMLVFRAACQLIDGTGRVVVRELPLRAGGETFRSSLRPAFGDWLGGIAVAAGV